MKPEQTQGGGFGGGTFIGAPNVDTTSPLTALSESLGVVSRNISEGLTSNFLANIENKKQEALDAAAVYEQTTAGYTAEQLGVDLQSEPMAAKFKANPYLLPAIEVYRGRKTADALALQAAESGIEAGDSEGMAAFYQANAPKLDDPFFARGFNEQNARLQAQFSQQALSKAFDAAEADALAGAGQLYMDAFELTGDPAAAAKAVRESIFGKSIDGKELSGFAVGLARKLAIEGNVEAFEALVDSPRDGIGPLSKDALYLDDIAAFREQAKTQRNQATQHLRTAAFTSIAKMIDEDGITEAALLASPEFQAMADFDQAEGGMSQEQSRAVMRLRDRNEANRREAAQQRMQDNFAAQQQAAIEAAIGNFNAGQGYKVGDVVITDEETGSTKKITGSALSQMAVDALRTVSLGADPFSLTGEDAKRYRPYFDKIVKSGHVDTKLKRALDGMSSSLTIEGLAEDPASAVQALTIYRNMSEDARLNHAPTGPARTILANAEYMLQHNPRLDPELALKRAVTMSKSPVILQDNYNVITKAAKKVELANPLGGKEFFFFGPGKVNAPVNQVREYVTFRANEHIANGMPVDAAADAAAKEASSAFVMVNGAAVRLPEKPLASGMSPGPEEWAKQVDALAKSVAAEGGFDASEVQVIHISDNNYSVVRQPKGKDSIPEFIDNVDAASIFLARVADAAKEPPPKTAAEIVASKDAEATAREAKGSIIRDEFYRKNNGNMR